MVKILRLKMGNDLSKNDVFDPKYLMSVTSLSPNPTFKKSPLMNETMSR